ncbi:MAG: PKD domain-containing protein [Caldilineaceae bacterium]
MATSATVENSTTTDVQIWQSSQPITGDATRLLFQSDRSGNRDIFVMQMNGSHLQQLTTHSADDISPIWSPDGKKIAFVSFRDGNWELYVMNADGSAQTRLTNQSRYDGSPTWSPDGNKIAFASERDGNREIYLIDSNGSNLQRLTNSPRLDDSPAWSPDGSKIGFVSERDEDREIYLMNRDGSGLQRLTTSPGIDDQPDWAPGGNKIAFVSMRDDGLTGEIYVMDAHGQNQERLTDNSFYETSPVWAPDGDRILFSRFLFAQNNQTQELFTISASGDFPTQLTSNQVADSEPTWQPLALNEALLTYRITITNTTAQSATDVQVQDILPVDVNFLFLNAADWDCNTPSAGTNGTVDCVRATLTGNEQSTIEIFGDLRTQTPGKVITNTATVAAANDAVATNNSATTVRQTTDATDLVLTMQAPPQVDAGEELTYTLNLENLGVTAAQNVALVDSLPAEVTLLGCTASGVGSCLSTNGLVTVSYPSLIPAQTESVLLRVLVIAPNDQQLSNSASVSANTLDLNANDNQASALTEVTSQHHDVRISHAASGNLFATNATLAYQLHVYNAGPTDITLLDTGAKSFTNTQALPIAACTKNSASCFSTISVSGLSAPLYKVRVSIFEFAHDKPGAVDLLLVAPDGSKVTLLSDAGGDFDPGVINMTFDDRGNAANENQMLVEGTYHPTNFGASDDFAALGTVNDSQPTLGRLTSLTNPNGSWKLYAVDDSGVSGSINGGWAISFLDGSAPIQMIAVKDVLPVGSTFVGATGEGWLITHQTNTITATRPELLANVTSTLLITVAAPASAGWITSTASVVAAGDSNTTNNSASVAVQVQEPIGQVQAFNSGPHKIGLTTQLTATISAGSNATYQWNFGDNSAIAAGQSVAHSYSAVGVYTATVTVSNGLNQQIGTTTISIQPDSPDNSTKVYLPVILGK